MKKTISLLISIVCLFALSVCVFANEKPGDKLEVKLYCEVDGRYYFADVAENNYSNRIKAVNDINETKREEITQEVNNMKDDISKFENM